MNFFFVAGFDFGTSYSKVVVQDQLTGIQKVVTFGEDLGALLPSCLRVGEGWISGPEGNYDGLMVSYPKLLAADAVTNQPLFSSVTSHNLEKATAFLGIKNMQIFAKVILTRYFLSVIQGIRRFIDADDDWGLFDPTQDPMVIQIAVPTGLLQKGDQKVEDLMQHSLMVATTLNDQSQEHLDYSYASDIVTAIENTEELPAQQSEELQQRCITYPEVAAGVQPILQSPNVRDGKFITLDVGAGTVDLNAFHRWTKSDHKTLDYWACAVEPLGFARLPVAQNRSGRGTHEISANAISETAVMDQLRKAVHSLMNEAFEYQPYESYGDGPSPWMGETQAYIWGGGSEYSPYLQNFLKTLESYDIGIHNINQLPKPRSDFKLPPGIKFGRLAVAFGLSYHFPNLKEIRLPHNLRTYAETYGIGIVKRNQTGQTNPIPTGKDCDCMGNPMCPRCFGSGNIKQNSKPSANLKVPKPRPESQKTHSGKIQSPRLPKQNLLKPSKQRLQIERLIAQFEKVPKPMSLARRIRALNLIHDQCQILDQAKEREFIVTVKRFLDQNSHGVRGKLLICKGSARQRSAGCDLKAEYSKDGKQCPIYVLHKDPESLEQAVNEPLAPLLLQLYGQIATDHNTGELILRSIPPYQLPSPL